MYASSDSTPGQGELNTALLLWPINISRAFTPRQHHIYFQLLLLTHDPQRAATPLLGLQVLPPRPDPAAFHCGPLLQPAQLLACMTTIAFIHPLQCWHPQALLGCPSSLTPSKNNAASACTPPSPHLLALLPNQKAAAQLPDLLSHHQGQHPASNLRYVFKYCVCPPSDSSPPG
jgi:hypothetical protein